MIAVTGNPQSAIRDPQSARDLWLRFAAMMGGLALHALGFAAQQTRTIDCRVSDFHVGRAQDWRVDGAGGTLGCFHWRSGFSRFRLVRSTKSGCR